MEVKKIVEGMTAQQVAQVIDDNFKAQNKILEEDIAKQNSVIGVSEYKDFSEAEAVNVGDVRKYNGFLYECVEATTGAFDASKWKKSSFKAETEKKLSELAQETGLNQYPTFNKLVDYRSDEVVIYKGRMYRFTKPHLAGEWTGEDVYATSLKEEVDVYIRAIQLDTVSPTDIFVIPLDGIGYNTQTKKIRKRIDYHQYRDVDINPNAVYEYNGQIYFPVDGELIRQDIGHQFKKLTSENVEWIPIGGIQKGDVVFAKFLTGTSRVFGVKANGEEVEIVANLSGNDTSGYLLSSEYIALRTKYAMGEVELHLYKTDFYNIEKVMMERGSWDDDGSYWNGIDTFKSTIRNSYLIECDGVSFMILPSYLSYKVFFYDADMKLISICECTATYCSIPETTKYIRFRIRETNDIDVVDVVFTDGNFSQVKNLPVISEEKLVYAINDGHCATARLALPPTYKNSGNPTPVFLYLQGSGVAANWNFTLGNKVKDGITYLTDEGYAIIEIFSWGSYFYNKYPNCGKAYPYPTPTNLKSIKLGLEYICDRFNLDYDNMHILSWSQGGQNSLYYAVHNEIPFKSITMIAPVLDYLSMPGEPLYADTRKAIAEDLKLSGDVDYFGSSDFLSYASKARDFFRVNIEKIIHLNEAWHKLVGGNYNDRLQESQDDAEYFWTTKGWKNPNDESYYNKNDRTIIGEHCGVCILGSKDDDQTPYRKMVEVADQLRNGGTSVTMITLPNDTGGHSSAATGNREYVTTITGVEHNVAAGFRYAVIMARAFAPFVE